MSWVDDRLKRQERTEAERAFISVHAATLYDELWEEVSNRVDDARKGGMLVSTNGSAYQRAVLLGAPANRAYREPEQLVIALARDTWEIVAEAETVHIKIPLGVCTDGVVCLKHEGRRLTIHDAAKMILEPFLFSSRK